MTNFPKPDPRSDKDLVAACNRGEAAAFETLYYRYRDWVTRLARRFTGNDEDALDVLQEVFAYLLCKFPGFSLTSRMTTFLYPAVKHLAIKARRRTGRYGGGDNVLSEEPAPSAGEDPPAGEELEASVFSLPEGQREVLFMRFTDDMSLEEIAEALDLPTGTVKSRLHRAVKTLRGDVRLRRYFRQ